MWQKQHIFVCVHLHAFEDLHAGPCVWHRMLLTLWHLQLCQSHLWLVKTFVLSCLSRRLQPWDHKTHNSRWKQLEAPAVNCCRLYMDQQTQKEREGGVGCVCVCGGGIQTIYSKHLYRLLKSGRTGQLSTVRRKKKQQQNDSSQVLCRPVRQNVQHARNVWGRRKGSFVHSDLWTVQTLHTLTKTVLLWWLFAVASSQSFVCRGGWFRRLSVQKRKHTRMNQCFPFQTLTKHPFQSVHGGALGVTLQNWEPFFHHWQDSKVLLMKFSRVKTAPSRLF